MNNVEENNQIEEESFTKTSNNMEYQISNLKKEFEFQNQQKNQELEVLFDEINTENQELKKELLQTQFELEQEKQKNSNIKNTFLNINSSTISTILNDDQKNSEKNFLYLNDHIKLIKENSEKKNSELNLNRDCKLKNFLEEKKNFENNLQKILANKQDNIKSIMKLNDKFFGEIEFLINENYNKEKYIIALGEKYEIIKEEIQFLKERIFQEKINILEKINEINGINKTNYINLIQELQNGLENNNKNFYSEQILGPLENISEMISNIKKNEREIESNRYKLECENEILKNKIDILEQEKNELINKTSNFIFDKESIISENLLNKSQINKLNNEIQILKKENDELLKSIKDLNQELYNIKNKINLDLKKSENTNSIIITQKESMIKQLSDKNNDLMQNDINNMNKLKELNDQIMNLQQKISEYNIKENKYQNEILNLNKKLNEDIVTSKDDKQRYSVTEEINKNLSQKLENLQSEKTNIENATNILNNKFNNINIENTKIKNELNEAKKKNILLEQELINIKNKLTSNENNQDLLLAESDLLHKIQKKIREIYQIHFSNVNFNNNLDSQNNPDEVFIMLKNINEKLSSRNSALANQEINFNENFANLENSKNSQLYENILLYLVNIRSKNKIELAKIITEKNSQNISNNNSGEISQSMTHHSSSNYFNKKYYDELKYLLEDKYRKLEERIRQSITVGELEELLIEFKNLYEAVIDSIIQSFYIYKTELSSNNILTIEIPLDKYHQIINNTNTNLISIEKSLNKKINEYKTQGEKIESALSILIKNVNMIY